MSDKPLEPIRKNGISFFHHEAHYLINPKFEYRNTKQIRNSNIEIRNKYETRISKYETNSKPEYQIAKRFEF